jgi:hypothetical protein
MQTLTNWGPVAVIVAGYLLGIYFQNKRLDDFSANLFKFLDAKFEAVDYKLQGLDAKIEAKFEIQRLMLLRVEGVMDARLKHLEEKER